MNLKQNIFNIFKIIIGNESLLRKIQKNLCSKLFLKGLTLEFGAVEKKSKNFSFPKPVGIITNVRYANHTSNISRIVFDLKNSGNLKKVKILL